MKKYRKVVRDKLERASNDIRKFYYSNPESNLYYRYYM